ncbi:MAG: fatty-acid synthase [Deltaproteobacteria bacterium]|nr:MAG: fatty-acid synthase [Deltaproteobacteria bacterium]
MPKRDLVHNLIKQALINDGWNITDDPYVISYGKRFLFVDLGAEEGGFVGAQREGVKIAVEIKDFQGKSAIADLEQAVGQYVLYRLLLGKTDPDRLTYLAVPSVTYEGIFREPVGELVISDLPLNLIVTDTERKEVIRWIPPPRTGK